VCSNTSPCWIDHDAARRQYRASLTKAPANLIGTAGFALGWEQNSAIVNLGGSTRSALRTVGKVGSTARVANGRLGVEALLCCRDACIVYD